MESRFDTPAMKRTSDWILSQEFPSDITIQVGDSTFNLHKLPLSSRCGYIRKRASVINGSTPITHLDLTGMPGGAKAFELVVDFCYGGDLEITHDNVAILRCAAEHLEMTDDMTMAFNLIGKTESYLDAVALASLAGAVAVLRNSEELLPASEQVGLIGRCVDAIARITCSDIQFSMSLGATVPSVLPPKTVDDSWADEITDLRIDTFQRVLIAMKTRGFKGVALGTLIMLYAQKSLRKLNIVHGREMRKMEPRLEHEKRVVLETIVSLLPREKNTVSLSFLSMLLRAALCLDTTLACRMDLERRMAAQLGHAVLDDLLIPSFPPGTAGSTAFDVDAVQRILVGYVEHEAEAARRLDYSTDDDFDSPASDAGVVGRLMEAYLAEIASDVNLSIDKFTGFAEMIPERARFNEDGMYRAIYLKAHPHLSEAERKKVCKVMDCQKLSREACAHAAQNDRLPVQTVVQVLYHEQRRLREAPMREAHPPPPPSSSGSESPGMSYRPPPPPSLMSRHRSVPDEVARLQRENEELKMEILRLRMHLTDASGGGVPASGRPPLPPKKGGVGFVNSVSRKLGRLNPFMRLDSMAGGNVQTKPPIKDRRHSIS
ncbi:hypothetical protein QOZ80_3AG0238080 [Eleusine coracana subsp. coracana]|nr:hypothetical protein QOZ80_3AG0238080 [Eleusine coracana subsp. coracana]